MCMSMGGYTTFYDMINKNDAEDAVILKDVAIAASQEPTTKEACSGFHCPTMTDIMKEASKLPPTRQLYKELWHENEVCLLFSSQGMGKTILAMQIAEQLSRTDKVCYLDFELSLRQVYGRYKSEEEGEYQFDPKFYRPDMRVEQVMGEEEAEQRIFQHMTCMADKGCKIFVIDNITYLTSKLENGTVMVKLMKKLSLMKKKYGLSILILGHVRKRQRKEPLEADQLAGSKKIMNFVDSAFAIGCSINDNKQLYIKQIKVRECECMYGADNVILCRAEKDGNFLRLADYGYSTEKAMLSQDNVNHSKEAVKDKIVTMKSGGMSNRAIAKELKVSEGTVRNYLKDTPMVPIEIPLVWHKTSDGAQA